MQTFDNAVDWKEWIPSLLEGEAKFGPALATLDERSVVRLLPKLKQQHVTWREFREKFVRYIGESRIDSYYWPRLLAALSERFEHSLS